MKKIQTSIILLGIAVLCLSCASIPNSAVVLTEEIIKEAEHMHELNIKLINRLYEDRSDSVNSFITNIYTPRVIDNYRKLFPENVDYKNELPQIMESIIPVINRKKDSLQRVLNERREQLIFELNSNYSNYSKATVALQNLINAAVKVETAKKNAIASIRNLTGDAIDVQKVEDKINTLLLKVEDNFNGMSEIKK